VQSRHGGLRQFREVDPDVAPANAATFGELTDDVTDHRRRDRKADALTARSNVSDGRVHSDHPALEVDERSTAVPRVDRGVGLDEVLVGRDARLTTATADDTGTDAVSEAERVADSDHPLTDASRFVRAQRRRYEIVRVDA